MIERCSGNRQAVAHHARYVEMKIRVCRRWLSFAKFLADMGARPAGTSLDRKNGRLGYSLRNCRWATAKEQARNRTNGRLVKMDGRRISIAEASEVTGLRFATIWSRLEHGWSDRDALMLDTNRINVPGTKGFQRKATR